MTIELYTAYWRKAKENVSCYPSDLSFSTMKAGSFSPLAEFECSMMQIPLSTGYSPKRWKRCVDVMILKCSGNTELSHCAP
jgi:hypothetical protein